METLKFFWKYPVLITLLNNINEHLENQNYDFPFAVVGDAGRGKTMFALHLYELWHKVILKNKITKNNIKDISGARLDWLYNITTLKPLDMNINDEAADGLSSKEALKKFGRDVEKLYKVNRKKRLLTGLIALDFFDFPPFFRRRIRGLFVIKKRGIYDYYSMEGIKRIIRYNDSKKTKTMWGSYPLFSGVFPDYKGLLREPYDIRAQDNCDKILNEVIRDNTPKEDNKDNRRNLVYKLIDEGKTYDDIQKEMRIGRSTISKYLNERVNIT